MSKNTFTENSNALEKRVNSAILKAIATTGLCHIAPLLSLARAVDARGSIGLTYSTCVEDVQIKDMSSYMILRIVLSTTSNNKESLPKMVSVLYTFRMLTPSIFEPFVYISQDKENESVFVYVDEDEFLFSKAEDTEGATLEKIYLEAIERDKKILSRYIDLIRTGFTFGISWEGVNNAR